MVDEWRVQMKTCVAEENRMAWETSFCLVWSGWSEMAENEVRWGSV